MKYMCTEHHGLKAVETVENMDNGELQNKQINAGSGQHIEQE